MSFDKEKMIKRLCEKGFKSQKKKQRHDYYYYETLDGILTDICTFFSKGSEKYQTYGNDLSSNVKRQLHFTSSKEMNNFAQCSFSREDYEKSLIEQGLI